MAAVYLDSSALVKLVVHETESDALRAFLRRRRPWVSSALARTEVRRAVLPAGPKALAGAGQVLARCDLVRVTNGVLDLAGALEPAELRSLDAVHLATAQLLGHDLGTFVAYDVRLADAARHLGHRVATPD